MVDLAVGRYLSSHDQQRNIGHDIEYDEDNFEKREERVNHHIVCVSGDGEPLALHTKYPISGKNAKHGREKKPGSVDDDTPHEESLNRVNIHSVSPLDWPEGTGIRVFPLQG